MMCSGIFVDSDDGEALALDEDVLPHRVFVVEELFPGVVSEHAYAVGVLDVDIRKVAPGVEDEAAAYRVLVAAEEQLRILQALRAVLDVPAPYRSRRRHFYPVLQGGGELGRKNGIQMLVKYKKVR